MPQAISDEKKEFAYKQVFAVCAKYGFDKISMDEIAARTRISKATLYKYFKSKEDIVKHMVQNIISHMDSMCFSADEGINAVLDSMQCCYRKAVLATVQAGSVFMSDLKSKFPDLYRECISALDSVHKRFHDFYKEAVKKGYCRNIYIQLVSVQMKKVLPEIINSSFQSDYNIDLQTVIEEYYRLLLCQLLDERYIYVIKQDCQYIFSKDLAEILTNTLQMAD